MKNEHHELYFGSGTWALLAYLPTIFLFERYRKSLSVDIFDDDKRTYDIPPISAYDHFPKIENSPRLSDGDLQRVAFKHENEPFGSWTNKCIIFLCMFLMIVTLPWYQKPNSEENFTDGWPTFANVMLAFGIINAMLLGFVVYRWKPPVTDTSVSFSHGESSNNPISSTISVEMVETRK